MSRAVDAWYPRDDEGRALQCRHRAAMRVLLEHGRVEPHEALALLAIVVLPDAEQLEASLEAVREREAAAA